MDADNLRRYTRDDIGGLTQRKRIATLTTPLGEDVLVLVRFEGEETLADIYEYRIEALSDERDIDLDAVIGKGCCISFTSYGQQRYFHGVAVKGRWLGPRNDRFAYTLVLKPWFWLLGRTTNCRIFENKTAIEIIKTIFSDRGFDDYAVKTTGNYKKIDYCVQYRETDRAFVCRMMERYGIYYFFEHTSDKHTMVLADSRSSHKVITAIDPFPFLPMEGQDRHEREHVSQWSADRRFRTGKVELKDYDYLKPSANLLSDANGTAGYTRSEMEFYDYPGKYTEQDDGDFFAKMQLQAEQALDQRRYASGDAPSLFPGGLVTLAGQLKPSENVQYLVLAATHAFHTESYRTGESGLPDQIYQGSYSFLPSDRPFRSLLATPSPFVHGPQTAKVVGKSGEEIDVDEHGRILVQFYWDRKKMQSCRVRIAQVWSGKNWGGIFIPRIDQEVVVEFLEGDPDKPLVTGTVYNADNKVPYKLPDNKTKGGFKTDSSKGHGGYNEIVFEDKKSSEEIGVHAQKDLDIVVLNSETREIGEQFVPPMGSPSRSTTLKNGDDELTLSMGSQTVSINLGSQTTTVMQQITTTANLMQTHTVGMSSISITPASVSITSPVINLTAQATINITAPIINITGNVNIMGVLTVGGLLPMLLPA